MGKFFGSTVRQVVTGDVCRSAVFVDPSTHLRSPHEISWKMRDRSSFHAHHLFTIPSFRCTFTRSARLLLLPAYTALACPKDRIQQDIHQIGARCMRNSREHAHSLVQREGRCLLDPKGPMKQTQKGARRKQQP